MNYTIHGWELGKCTLFLLFMLNCLMEHYGKKWHTVNELHVYTIHIITDMKYIALFSGNELCGNGVGARVAADQYVSDTISLSNLVQDIYKSEEFQPQIIAPGGFFDANWFTEFLSKTPKLDVVTHHIYNLGPGMSCVSTHQLKVADLASLALLV